MTSRSSGSTPQGPPITPLAQDLTARQITAEIKAFIEKMQNTDFEILAWLRGLMDDNQRLRATEAMHRGLLVRAHNAIAGSDLTQRETAELLDDLSAVLRG